MKEEDFVQSEPKETVRKFFDGKYDFEILFIISWILYVYATVHWIRGLFHSNCFDQTKL